VKPDFRERERRFYDARAATLSAEELPPRELDPYERALLDALGPVAGRRVLEVGCGAGDVALELLDRGAELTAIDLSPAMVELAGRRAARFRPEGVASFRAAPVEATGLESGVFDRVVGKWILHHADVPAAARELARVLRPGGLAVFFENHDRNPLLRLARHRLLAAPGLQRVGTPDERPLDRADMRALLDAFGDLELRYPSFYAFEALSRALRYRAYGPLRALDGLVWRRLPRLRPYSYHVLVVLRRVERGGAEAG
jgi:ubiquinone/menaquinone biosynthesis C-methylase UbiE